MNSPVDIRPDHLEIVRDILREHLPLDVKVWVFGSRANWTTKDSSDLDLALKGKSKLSHKSLGALKDAFDDSPLPYTVDVVDLNRIGDSFRRIVELQKVYLPMDGGGILHQARLSSDELASSGMSLSVTVDQWQETTLGECVLINDSTYSTKEAWPTINYLDTGSITENRVSEIQRLEPGKHKIPSRARRKVQPGDIVYSTVRPNQKHFGLLKKIPENFLASTGFAVLRAKADVADTDFLYWFLAQDHIVDYLHSIAESSVSAYPSIKPSDLEQLPLSLPPLPEQRAIARILGTLDDKIELNRRMNETLEEMARALFKSWFVDFEPVRAKMEGRWRRGESLPGMPADCYDLFPDRLVPSELGEIPVGWEVKGLGEMIELNPREPMKRGTIAPYLNMAALPTSGANPDAPILRSYTSGTRFRNGDTLLARITPCLENGKTAYVQSLPGGATAWGSTEFIVMRPKPPIPPYYAYLLARDTAFRRYAIQSMTGTSGRQRARVEAIASYLIPYPPKAIWEHFALIVKSMFGKLKASAAQSRTLAVQRDTLLPKLVSGQTNTNDSFYSNR